MNKYTIRFCVALAMLAFVGSARADKASFDTSKMSVLGGGGTLNDAVMTITDTSKLVFTEGTKVDGNNCKPGCHAWKAGVSIRWPIAGSYIWYGATDGSAQMQTSRMASPTTGEDVKETGNGTGLLATTYSNPKEAMKDTYWWDWITPEDAFSANGGTVTRTLTMWSDGNGLYVGKRGTTEKTFSIVFPTTGLTLKDDQGIVWFPAVATNADGKVYGDLNVALKAGGTLGSVADASITENITLEDGIVYYKNGKNIGGLDKLTLLGGSYDFDPVEAGCTLGTGCIAEKTGDLWVVKPCPHDWEFAASGDTFTATCSKGCDYTPQTLKIKIDQASKTYDGTEITASLEYNTSAEEFATQTKATVGAISWDKDGDKTSAGKHTASVTITAGGTPRTISTSLTIEQANMSTTTVTMKNATMSFADKELTNAVDAVTAPGISASDWEIVDKTALYQSGSGYSNCTYTVTLQGKGNFTGTQTVTWMILAPTREFDSDAMGRGDYDVSSTLYNENYGEAVGRELVVTASTNIIFVNGYWWVGMTVELPTDINRLSPSSSLLTDDDNLRVTLSTTGKTYTGTQIYNKQVTDALFQIVDGDHASQWWSGIGTFQYFKTLRWFTPVSPAMVEEALGNGGGDLEFTMTVGGITGRWEGLKYTDFTIKVPVHNFIFKVRENESADIGNVSFTATKILLKTGSVVTNACAIDYVLEKNVYTDAENYDVFETKVSESCWVYSCEKEIVTITIPNVDHQGGKVVKVGDTEIQPTNPEKTTYKVRYGDTVTITYTAEAGYVPTTAERTMENVTGGETLTNLPVFTWPNVKVQAEEIEHASKAEIYTNGVLVGTSPCEVISNEMVTVIYTADEGYFFYDEQQKEYCTSNKLAAVQADANPTTVSKAGALPVVAAVAKIDTTYYPTLDKAIAGAVTNDTIVLLKGCVSAGAAIDLPLTLDENGFEATNVCIAATGKVAFTGATGSANLLRAKRPTLFGTLENGAKAVVADKTYVFVKALDAFYEDGHEVVATTYSEYGEYLESYPKFADGFSAVATNGTIYAIKNITNSGFTVAYGMTIDLAKAADGGAEYSLTIASPTRKTIGIEIGRQVSDVTFRGGTIVAGANAGITTFLSSSAANLTLDNVMIEGDAMLNDASVASKALYTVALNEGATTLTNTLITLPRSEKAYALYVSCYGASTGNAVAFCGENQLKGNILVNAQNDAPVTVAFGKIHTIANYALTVNKYNAETAITKATGTEYPIELTQPEFSWQNEASIDTLVFGKCLNLKTGKYFATLSEAFAAPAQSGETIRLCADVEESEDVHAAKEVTLDLNGHTLTAYLDVNGVSFEILGTNDYSRIVGDVWATNGANLSICGGTYDGGIRAYGSNKINIADAIIACTNANETALQLSSYGEYGTSYDEKLTVTVVNSRLTGYSAACIGGGTLTVSNSVLTAFGAEKKSIDRVNWMGGTGDALVIDQVPGCPISVTLEAGTKLQQQLDIGTEQLGWYTNAQGTVTATVKKRDGVDVLAVDGYYWDGDVGGMLTMTKDPVPPSPTVPAKKMITKNLVNLAPAFTSNGLDPDGSVNVDGEEVTIRPEDLTITVGDTADTVSFTSLPDSTYELLATDTIGGTYTVVDRVRATGTETVLTAQKTGAAARFYTVRLVP